MDAAPTGSAVSAPTGRDPADVHANKDFAALSYVWALSLCVLLLKRHSPFAQFHARQGFVLFLASIVFWFIPFVGRILELAVLAFAVIGFLAAAQGQWKELPLVFSFNRIQLRWFCRRRSPPPPPTSSPPPPHP